MKVGELEANEFITKNYPKIVEIAKRVLKDKWRDGISSYYMHIQKKGIGKNPIPYCYWYFNNLNRPYSELNYVPVTVRNDYDDINMNKYTYNPEDEWNMNIDLDNDILVDFLNNNKNNGKWIKIWKVIYDKKIEMDLFEEVIFDYIFKQGLSISEIAKITNNNKSWIYTYRKSLINKIKLAIEKND